MWIPKKKRVGGGLGAATGTVEGNKGSITHRAVLQRPEGRTTAAAGQPSHLSADRMETTFLIL